MKSSKAVYKSFKNLVVKTNSNSILTVDKNLGRTIIPVGSDDGFIELPKLQNTYSFNIINTDEMTGNITLKTSGGASLKGLMLRSNGGSLSIDPIQVGTDELTLESDVKDGCYIQTVSNGNEWFVWSVATGGTINVRNGGIVMTHPPTIPGPSYADVTNVVITSDVRFVGGGLEARHDLVLSGEGEPGAFLTISETTGNSDAALVFPVTIQIASDGTWELNKNTLATNLPNGRYEFDFTPTLGNGVQGIVFNENPGAINFAVPSTFTPDPAEVVDFASGASASFPDGTSINVVVDSSAWTPNLAHGDTFDIIYSITDPAINGGNPVTQTVTGEIVDDTPPAAPVFTAAAITNNNELNASGTAEPGKTITLFRGNQPLSPTVVSDPVTGDWSIGPIVLTINGTFTLKAQASEIGSLGSDGLNRSVFGEYSPDFDFQQLITPTPTIGVNGEQTSVWTNTANSFTISGTTEIGATIEVLDGANPATLVSGPTVDGAGDWSATIDVAPESVTSLSAKATIANHHQSAAASFQLNVDRVAPVINNNQSLEDLTAYLGNLGTNNDVLPATVDQSSGLNGAVLSDWVTQVTAAEGAKTVTYTATDNAGNTAYATRTVNVSTQVVVPTNLVATGGEQEATITGDVSGSYPENLVVKIYVTDSNGLEEVYQENGVDVEFSVNSNGTFSASLDLSPDDYTFEAITINSLDEESAQSQSSNSITVTAPTVQHLEEGASQSLEPGSLHRTHRNAVIRPDGLLDVDGVTSNAAQYAAGIEPSHVEHYYSGGGDFANFSSGDPQESRMVSIWFHARSLSAGTSNGTGNVLVSNNAQPTGGTSNSKPFGSTVINDGFFISVQQDRLYCRTPRPAAELKHMVSISTDTWYKIDMVWRGSGSSLGTGEHYNELYLNGQLVANSTSVQTRRLGENLRIGWGFTNVSANPKPFNGFIDGVVLREEALSPAEILTNYNNQLSVVNAYDVTPPTITLLGDNPLAVTEGSVDSDPGATTSDPPVTSDYDSIIDDTTVPGNYTVTYTATDASGNTTTATRDVEVVTESSFIEDISTVIARNSSKINTSSGIFEDTNSNKGVAGGMKILLDTDGIIQYGSGQPVNDEFTISWWMKPNATQASGYIGIIGYHVSLNRRLQLNMSNVGTGITTPYYQIEIGSPNLGNLKVNYNRTTNGAVGDGNWHHYAIRCQAGTATTGHTQLITQLFVDGTKLSSTGGFANINGNIPIGHFLLPPSTYGPGGAFYFGTSTSANRSILGDFDSMQIGDGIALSDSQINWIAQDPLRSRTITDASTQP